MQHQIQQGIIGVQIAALKSTIFPSAMSTSTVRARMWLLVALVIVLTRFGRSFAQAPSDADPFCTETLPGIGVNILDYAPNVKPLMDSRHYQNLLPPHADAVWQRVDNDNNNPPGTSTEVSHIHIKLCHCGSINICMSEFYIVC